jgi:hypothetical protein
MGLMKINTELRDQIFQVITNQIKSNNPPETKVTYERLIALGYSEFETKQLIGQCVAVEMFSVIKEQKPLNEARYVKNLKQLPKEPFD